MGIKHLHLHQAGHEIYRAEIRHYQEGRTMRDATLEGREKEAWKEDVKT